MSIRNTVRSLMLKAPDQTNSLSKINEIQQPPPLLDAIESNKIVEPLGKKLDRIDLIDDQKEKIKAAAIIGADAVFRLLGKRCYFLILMRVMKIVRATLEANVNG